MGEPAYKLPEEDRPNIAPDLPQLRAMEGGGEGDGVPSGNLSSVPDDEQDNFYNPNDSDETDSKSLSKDELEDKESSGTSELVGGAVAGFAKNGPAGLVKFGLMLASKKYRNKALAGGGIVASLGALIIAGLLSLSSLRVVGYMDNLQSYFFASSEAAAEQMSQNLFRNYVTKQLVPGMVKNNCTTTRVNKSCAYVTGKDNLVGALYGSWRDSNLEGKLATKHGLEIRRENNQFFIRSSTVSKDIDIGRYDPAKTAQFDGKMFAAMDRTEIRRQIRLGYENETLSKKIMYKFSVGRLLERKYGIRRCVIACATRDNVSNTIDAKKGAFKSYLAERVLTPRSEMMGLALECAQVNFECAKPGESDANGERLSEYERNLQTRLLDYRGRFGTTSLEDLGKEADVIKTGGFTEYLVKKVAGETAGKVITKAIPVVGWIDLGARIFKSAQNASSALKKINYVMNSTSMVALFSLYRSHADEIKSGRVDATMVGSIADSFSANPANDQGGGAAESTPVYNAIMNRGSAPTSSTLASLIAAPASAQSEKIVTDYRCDDGKPVSTGKLVCPEVSFDAESKVAQVADVVSKTANSPEFLFAGPISSFWLATGGKLLDYIGLITSKLIPSYTPEQVKVLIGWVQDTVFKKILINAFTDNPSGGRIFELIVGGADVAANDFAHYGQGGKRISSQQATLIRDQQYNEKKEEFNNLSLYAKMFSKDTSMSMISQVAFSMPENSTKFTQSFAQLLSNPGKLFSTLFSASFNTRAHASVVYKNPLGLADYGYPPDDPVLTTDPQIYWDQNNCDNPDNKKIWGDKSTINELTQTPEHDITNGCTLLRSAIAAGGGRYNSDLLEPDGTNATTSVSNTSTAPATGNLVNGEAQALAKQILDSGKVTFDTANYRQQVEAVASGSATCNVNPLVLQLVATAIKTHTVNISSLNRYCTHVLTASGVSSYHYKDGGGHAVDFNYVDGVHATGSTANEIQLLRELLPLLPSGSGIGQSTCRSGSNVLTMPPGITQFVDECNHVHLQVPVNN